MGALVEMIIGAKQELRPQEKARLFLLWTLNDALDVGVRKVLRVHASLESACSRFRGDCCKTSFSEEKKRRPQTNVASSALRSNKN